MESKAGRLRIDACDGGVASACREAAIRAEPEGGSGGDLAAAADLHRRADAMLLEQCEAGDPDACAALGDRCIDRDHIETVIEEIRSGARTPDSCVFLTLRCAHGTSPRDLRGRRCDPDDRIARTCPATMAFFDRACALAIENFSRCEPDRARR